MLSLLSNLFVTFRNKERNDGKNFNAIPKNEFHYRTKVTGFGRFSKEHEEMFFFSGQSPKQCEESIPMRDITGKKRKNILIKFPIL